MTDPNTQSTLPEVAVIAKQMSITSAITIVLEELPDLPDPETISLFNYEMGQQMLRRQAARFVLQQLAQSQSVSESSVQLAKSQ